MKRKSLKRLLLAATTILTMAATGIAASGAETGSITLTVKTSEPGHTFEAYQVFDGTYTIMDGNGVLSNIEWGDAVENNSAALLEGLKTDSIIGTYFKDADTAENVAEVLQNAENFANNSENLDQFAAIVEEHLGTATETFGEGTPSGDYYLYQADLLPGYYLIKDQDGSLEGNSSYTKFMLELISETTVDAKLDTPTLEKEIVEQNGSADKTNSAGIGSVIEYELKSKVPAMDGYDTYYFVVHDTLSKGLEYVEEEGVEITIGGTELAATEYEVTAESEQNGETALKIVFKNFIQHKQKKGLEIAIRYQAKVTKDAVVGEEGNHNTAKLVYSNDPSYDYDGDKDEPEVDVPTGETTNTTTHTYAAKLKVAKVDDKGDPLAGAEFELSGDGINSKVNIDTRKTTSYVQQDAKEGWVLVDGKMEKCIGTEANHDTIQHYKQVTVTDTVVSTEGTAGKITTTVDANGYIVFTGLGEGTYTLKETRAPEGYNKLDNDIKITLICTPPTEEGYKNGETKCTWEAKLSEGQADVEEDGTISFKVMNKKGSMLPSTGGIGTTIFTVSGVILMLGAVVALIIKKKKGRS